MAASNAGQSSALAPVYVLATLDTKFDEAKFLGDAIRAEGVPAVLIDVGTLSPPQGPADVSRTTVAAFHPEGTKAVLGHEDRGVAVIAMSQALRGFLLDAHQAGRCSAVVGLGGTGGTSMI